MKRVLLTLSAVLVFTAACSSQKDAARSKVEPSVQKLPFSLSIVPETYYGEQYGSNIVMARDRPHTLHVVLTNVSNGPQPVWEYWNSWGFQVISLKLATADGTQFVLSKKDQGFDKNVPSIFIVEPGEHQVFAIVLDESWVVKPALPMKSEMPITLKAVYYVAPTRDSTKYKVWTGSVESHSYNVTLWQE